MTLTFEIPTLQPLQWLYIYLSISYVLGLFLARMLCSCSLGERRSYQDPIDIKVCYTMFFLFSPLTVPVVLLLIAAYYLMIIVTYGIK